MIPREYHPTQEEIVFAALSTPDEEADQNTLEVQRHCDTCPACHIRLNEARLAPDIDDSEVLAPENTDSFADRVAPSWKDDDLEKELIRATGGKLTSVRVDGDARS